MDSRGGVVVRRLRILLDCDGILSDFCTACFRLIEQLTGDVHTHEEVTHWDVFNSLGKGHLKPVMKETAAQSGWCINFPVYAGVQDVVKRLEEIGEVVIVTSPMSVPHWTYEREIWLMKHFGIPKGRIVNTEGKQYVTGDVFIDDADDNCVKWHAEYPDALTILWDAPYNRNVDLSATGIRRVKTWDDVFALLEALP